MTAKLLIFYQIYFILMNSIFQRGREERDQPMKINDNWTFEKEGCAEQVTLPHTWNNVDGQTGVKNYEPGKFNIDYWRGECRYCRRLTLDDTYRGKQVYLLFEGVNATARVLVNRKLAGEHAGGYTAFQLDITDLIQIGENELEVRVDNSHFQTVAPLDADFTFYGGIYRDVHLIARERVCLGCESKSYKQLKVRADGVSWYSAAVTVTAWPENHLEEPVDAVLEISVREGEKTVAQATHPVRIRSGEQIKAEETFTIENPHLWNGRQDPFRYLVTARLLVAGGETDCAEARVGLRYFRVDQDEGFFLNGEPYPLRGVSRHQDRDGLGNALTEKEHREDFQILYDIGATAVRLAHYPQADFFYDLCDEYGLIVWAEIPFVNTVGGSGSYDQPDAQRRTFFGNVRSQLVEMIRQNYNHPSICFWGLENEVAARFDKVMIPFMEELYALARKEDDTRLITHAVNIREGRKWKSDLYAWNYYPGWYGTTRHDLGRFMDSQRRSVKKPVAISEYGAGGSIHQHTFSKRKPNPDGEWHPEEYQALCHESFIRQIQKRNYLWATFVWNLFDFGSNRRHEGDRYGVNDKGLVTFDRKVKKDAYYVYQAAWSEQPVLHLASRRYDRRPAGKTWVKIYTNLPEVRLTCGEQSFTLKRRGRVPFILKKKLLLRPGENVITAAGAFKGHEIRDEMTITGTQE